MRRVVELDALRGAAGLVIVFYHLAMHGHFGNRTPALLLQLGGSAVDLFFVLSGFLITSIILRHGGGLNFLRAFYARRSLRIWPIYYLSLIGVVLLNRFLAHPYRLDALPQYLTYTQRIQDYWGGTRPPFEAPFGHTWTLAIEEQFYLIWPAMLLLLGTRRLLPLALATAAFSTLFRTGILSRILGMLHAGFSPEAPQYLLLGRCDGFAAGALLAALTADPEWFARRAPRLRLIWGTMVVGLGAYMAAAAYAYPVGRIPYLLSAATWFCFAFVGLVLTAVDRPVTAPLRYRPLVFLGVVSYGLYLYHPFVEEVFELRGLRAWWTGWPIAALSVVVAVASWYAVERPILALKDRFRYDPRPSAALTTPDVPELPPAAARMVGEEPA